MQSLLIGNIVSGHKRGGWLTQRRVRLHNLLSFRNPKKSIFPVFFEVFMIYEYEIEFQDSYGIRSRNIKAKEDGEALSIFYSRYGRQAKGGFWIYSKRRIAS
jgi:hypothetical protein